MQLYRVLLTTRGYREICQVSLVFFLYTQGPLGECTYEENTEVASSKASYEKKLIFSVFTFLT